MSGRTTLSRHQISLYAFASLYRCGPFEKLEHILQNAVPFVNAFLEFFRKTFTYLRFLSLAIAQIPFHKLLSNAAIAAGMFHFPADAFDTKLFRVQGNASFFQFMSDDLQVFILRRR